MCDWIHWLSIILWVLLFVCLGWLLVLLVRAAQTKDWRRLRFWIEILLSVTGLAVSILGLTLDEDDGCDGLKITSP
ncbi:hypothetical protein, partial [Roseiflexus sp.]|uniref:hypothetical protein n=1 Tax=Roseiflexus sp. TaxID=2562120 RepID=UPI00398B913E